MASLYSALFIYVCIALLLHSHVAKYYTTTAYASRENSKGTDNITTLALHSTPNLWKGNLSRKTSLTSEGCYAQNTNERFVGCLSGKPILLTLRQYEHLCDGEFFLRLQVFIYTQKSLLRWGVLCLSLSTTLFLNTGMYERGWNE